MADASLDSSTIAAQSPWRVLAQHFPAFLTVTYLISAAAGATYHFFLYREFGLVIFDFWETGDYLASAVREPQIIFYVILAVLTASAIIWNEQWDAWSRARGRFLHALLGNYFWEKLGLSVGNYPILGTLFGLIFFFALTYKLADDHAEAIRDGRRGTVEAVAEAFPEGRLQAALISRTSAFVILIDQQDGDRYVVPIESLTALYYAAAPAKLDRDLATESTNDAVVNPPTSDAPGTRPIEGSDER